MVEVLIGSAPIEKVETAPVSMLVTTTWEPQNVTERASERYPAEFSWFCPQAP